MQKKTLNILVSPLDWGLGHASRCIPLINQLIAAGHAVSIAGHGRSFILLQKEFPHLKSFELPGFSPSYSKSGRLLVQMLLLLPEFLSSLIREHRLLGHLIEQQHFDVVISDNRYGLWSRSVKSIFITHQVMIKMPDWLRFAEYPVYLILRMLISRFDECWIPDTEKTPGLSGDLSHKYALPGNAQYVGRLSRFSGFYNQLTQSSNGKKVTVIISGPEPQRSLFQDLVCRQLAGTDYIVDIISGKPESDEVFSKGGNLKIHSHASTAGLAEMIAGSSLVICRSGYSSIMDLDALGAKAFFVPTPGQTEQIYLAKMHQTRGTAYWRHQHEMDLKSDILTALAYSGFIKTEADPQLSAAIAKLEKK